VSPQPYTPIVVQVAEEPTRETTVADILLGAVGFVGIVLLAALVVGIVAGAAFYYVRKRRSGRVADAPAISAHTLTR
jgi:uncharacterized protein YneF (UPF0154 family)